jgi:tetratricopeptide (TPR) repeat protein
MSNARFSMTSIVRSAVYGASIAALPAAIIVCASSAIGDPVSISRQDLWDNPVCRHSPRDVSGIPSFTSRMLDYNRTIEADVEGGRPEKADADIFKAYAYAKQVCYPLWLGDADLLFEDGKYQDAFAAYRTKFFEGGGISFSPAYDDEGAVEPLRNGMNAAAKGDFSSASALFLESIAKAPDFQEPHFMLGNLLFSLGRHAEAHKEWLAVLASYGDVAPEKDNFGPDQPWLSALRMYVVHRKSHESGQL